MTNEITEQGYAIVTEIKQRLDKESSKRNMVGELTYDKPDPLMVATRHKDEYIGLICALFAYGNAKQIVKFLDSLEFDLLDTDDNKIKSELSNHYYRFQNSDDVSTIFIALKRLRESSTVEDIFHEGYNIKGDILDGLWLFIDKLRSVMPRESHGYNFLTGRIPKRISSAGTYKRYLMYLRWMVRDDNIDLGLWKKIPQSALLMPLDTHTFNVSKKLGLLNRKSCDMKASIELTQKLREFDPDDPIKYDFALYRIGQEGLV